MREDFKYPYRIITRKEEIEGNEALGFLFGIVIFLPFMLIAIILKMFQGIFSKHILLAVISMIGGFIFTYSILSLIF
jgi:hypothetical protein